MNKIYEFSKIDIAHGIIFKKLNLKKDTFDDRLLCQKKIYLLQELGFGLGYNYNWYVHGPYSPVLTDYIYSKMDFLLSNDFSHYSFKEQYNKMIDDIQKLDECDKQGKSTCEWYELLASLVYLYLNRSNWLIESNQSLIDKLVYLKPKYTLEICEYGLNVLRDRSVIKNEW